MSDSHYWVPIASAFIALAGVLFSLWLASRNLERQLRSAHALKLAEMRQEWINELRIAMAKFQSWGVTPNANHQIEREFYEAGTLVELFMNPSDPDYDALQKALYQFLKAESVEEKFFSNPGYVEVCQRILKREWEVVKQDIAAATSR